MLPRLLILFFIATFLRAQEPDAPKFGSVKGVVVNSVSNAPVPNALVFMQAAASGSLRGAANREAMSTGGGYSISANDSGEFEFKDVEPGAYWFSATRRGFVDSNDPRAANASRMRRNVVRITAGNSVPLVKVTIVPQAVIAGRITDSKGEPFESAQVIAMQSRHIQNGRHSVPVGTAKTNDLGEFRISGLGPGRYTVAALLPPERTSFGPARIVTRNPVDEVYPPTYYPGVTEADRSIAIEIAAGTVRQGVDIVLHKSSARRVRGHVMGPGEKPPSRLQLILLPAKGLDLSNMRFGQTITEYDGAFEFRPILPGSYVLHGNDGENFIRMPVEVGESDISDLQLVPQPLLSIKGEIHWDGGAPEDAPQLKVHLVAGTMIGAPLDGEGVETFHIEKVSPDKMRVSLDGMSNQDFVQAIRYGNRTIEDEMIDIIAGAELQIVMKRGAASVEGTVESSDGPAVNATVILAPATESRRGAPSHYKQATTDQNGHFMIQGAAPGEYVVCAFEQIEGGAWFEPDFLTRYERQGERVKLEEKGHETKKLTVIQVK